MRADDYWLSTAFLFSLTNAPDKPLKKAGEMCPPNSFVLAGSTYQSAPLSSPTVSDRFLPRWPQHGFNATCDER
jgi:hypothetical protein